MKRHPKWFKFFFVTCIVALSLWVADVIEGTLTGIGFPIAINHASSFYLMQIIMDVFNAIYWVLNKFDC